MPDRVHFFRVPAYRPFPWANRLKHLCEQILQEEQAQGDVNVILCSDQEVRSLNRDYRKQDKVTDVLSFEWHDAGLLGEIYLAEAQIRRQAPRFGNTFYQELRKMLVHGILHLAGYDHIHSTDRQVMRSREIYYLPTS